MNVSGRSIMKVKLSFLLALFVSSASLVGCQSVVPKFYIPASIGEDQRAKIAKIVGSDEVVLDKQGNVDVDFMRKKYPNYIALGFSEFKGTEVSDDEIKTHAASIGASVVIVFQGYLGNMQTGSVTNAVPIPGAGAIAFNNPIKKDIHEYHMAFLAKYYGKRERIGFDGADLSAELQQKLQRNKGVVVTKVNASEPAFEAEMLLGDVITTIDGVEIINRNSVGLAIREACNKEKPFIIQVIRGENKTKDLTIKSCI